MDTFAIYGSGVGGNDYYYSDIITILLLVMTLSRIALVFFAPFLS